MERNSNMGNLLKLAVKSAFIAFGGFLFPLLYIFFPTMYVTESLKEGIIKIFLCFAVVCAMMGLLFTPIAGVVLFTLFGPLILVFHYMIVTKREVYTTLGICALVFFLSVLFILFSFGITGDVLNAPETKALIVENVKSLMETGDFGLNSTVLEPSMIIPIYNRSIQLLPATIIMISLIISYVTFTMTGRSLFLSGRLIPQPSSFEFFQLPKELIVWAGITLIGLYIVGTDIHEMVQVVFINLFTIMGFLLFFQGLSIMKFTMAKFGFGPMMQFLFMIVVFFTSFFQLIVALVGLTDTIFNFRKI